MMGQELVTFECPRCGSVATIFKGHTALSRTDSRTEVCSPCGTREAVEAFTGTLTPQREWFSGEGSDAEA